MNVLRDIIANHQDWLVERIIEIAREADYTRYSSTLVEAWRIMVLGLSQPLLSELEKGLGTSDAASEFAVQEGRVHQARGIALPDFMGLLKCCRRGFVDLVNLKATCDQAKSGYLSVVERYFDRIELNVLSEWSKVDDNGLMVESQSRNRDLTNEKNKFLTICESLSNPIFHLDPEHRIEWMNDAARVLFEELGLSTFTYYSPQEVRTPDWLIDIGTELAQNQVQTRQSELDLEVSSSLRHFRIDASRMADVSGKYPGSVVILTDVTYFQKALEGAFRYQILARRMADVILMLDNDSGLILEANDAALQVLGISEQDVRMLTIYDLVEPDRYGRVPERMAEVKEKGPLTFETKLCRKDGTIFPVEISAEAAQVGDATLIACIIRDISERREAKAKLQMAYTELEQLFLAVADGLVAISPDYTITRVNQKLVELMGRTADELIGSKCYEYLRNPECHTPNCALSLLANGAPTHERETEVIDANGEKRCLLISSAPLRNSDGAFAGIVESIKDVTERNKAIEELKTYRLVLEQAQDIILFIRMDGKILGANDAAVKAYGYTREEFDSLTINDLRLPGTEETHRQQMEQAYQSGIMVDTIHRRKDGTTFPVEVSARGATIRGQKALVSIARDITERKEAEREIRYLSFHDKLTGLFNRAYFEELLEQSVRNILPCSIILGDLNGLKVVNDAFGHAAGDQLLVEMARILNESSRADDIVARIGGDEFALMLPGADEAAALSVAERIRTNCQKSALQPLQPSIALGVATRISTEQDVFELFQEAESRMYRRKMLEANSARSYNIQSLQRSLHEKSNETEEHTVRLGSLASMLAEAMNLSMTIADELKLLAALHDIGKIAIPDEILNKPGPLTPEEWEIMKRHPEIGYRIARTSPELAPIAESILAHHERWDGQGYPRGLSGEAIPLGARILSVVDAYDAMTSTRPYRKAVSQEEAISELLRNVGTQFDPTVVPIFVSLLRQ